MSEHASERPDDSHDAADEAAELREHERRVAEQDPAERSPAGEDEAGEASIEDLGGTS